MTPEALAPRGRIPQGRHVSFLDLFGVALDIEVVGHVLGVARTVEEQAEIFEGFRPFSQGSAHVKRLSAIGDPDLWHWLCIPNSTQSESVLRTTAGVHMRSF